jgi:alpha-ketoglutarate-dependent 2,4-dichlorophenoxyacetate dioxygenase
LTRSVANRGNNRAPDPAEFVYSHAWRRSDLVMWDNRTTMHRARRFDRNEVRDVRRTTLAGEAPLVEQ